MKQLFVLSFLCLICMNCKPSTKEKVVVDPTISSYEAIQEELLRREKLDQTAAWIPKGKFEQYSKEEWQAYKDSVFTSNKTYLEAVLDKHGFPGIDKVGKEGAHAFWLMTQHCDFDVAFQERVLSMMKVEVDKQNASRSNYAYLVDRVLTNKGEKIRYGTQVSYVRATGQAIPKPLEDSLNVNKRRAEVGLEPIEAYLNGLTKRHFNMNKSNMLKRGITEPKLYNVGGQ